MHNALSPPVYLRVKTATEINVQCRPTIISVLLTQIALDRRAESLYATSDKRPRDKFRVNRD